MMEFETRQELERISMELNYLEAVISMAWLWASQSGERVMENVLASVSTKLEWLAEDLDELTAEQGATA